MDRVATERAEVRLLTDLPVHKDEFGGHQRIANAITDVVLNEREGGKAIALEGGWGSGKSSVVRMLETGLAGKGHLVCTFDAWAHEGDPLRRTFLESLIRDFQEQGVVDKDKWTEELELLAKRRRITEINIVRRTTALGKWFAVAALLVAPGSAFSLGALNRGATLGLGLPVSWLFITGLVLALSPLLVLGGNLARVCFRRARGKDKTIEEKALLWAFTAGTEVAKSQQQTTEAPDPTSIEFEKKFVELMTDALPATCTRKIVIVLDNLDRIPKETAHALWSTIRLFAETLERKSNHDGHWTERLWLVVPYDREGAGSIWKPENQKKKKTSGAQDDDDEQSSNEGTQRPKPHSVSAAFFDKAFQVRFTVPPLHIADWEQYLKQLIRSAMPKIGTEEELHRVYRLSERLADENGRPPSPRALKLYVNDIGALVRQFEIGRDGKIRIDHLALYTILRRQDKIDVVSWVLNGDHQKSPFTSVMLDESYVDAVLAVHFGTEDFTRARTITLRGPLRQALRNGDGEGLKKVATSVPAFWSVAENELSRSLDDGGTKQQTIIQIAQAITASEIESHATGPYCSVLPRFAQEILLSAKWSAVNRDSANAAGALLQLAATKSVTRATLDRFTKAPKDEKSEDFDAGDWAEGVICLFGVVTKLGHDWNISLSTAPETAKGCLVELVVRKAPDELFRTLKCQVAAGELQQVIGPAPTQEWSNSGLHAVKGLLSAPQINTPWGSIINNLASRLQATEVDSSEAGLLWQAFFVCYVKAPKDAKKQLSEIVAAATFYPSLAQWADDPSIVAYMLAAMILSMQVVRPVSSPSEQAGFNVVNAIYNDASQYADVVESLVTFSTKNPYTGLLPLIVEQRSQLLSLASQVIRADEIRDRLGTCMSVPQFFEHYTALSEVLGDDLVGATKSALAEPTFARALDEQDVQIDQANVHCMLVEAAALARPIYRSKISGAIDAATKDAWEEAIRRAGSLYHLLVLVLREGVQLPNQFSAGLEAFGRNLVSEQPKEAAWETQPESWDVVFDKIGTNHRGNIANHIVDELHEHSIPRFANVIGLFGDNFHMAFGKSSRKDLVRKIAKPILESRDFNNLQWLVSAARQSTEFWKNADKSDRGTFETHLVGAYRANEDSELVEVLSALAGALGITIPLPQAGAENESVGTDNSDEATE